MPPEVGYGGADDWGMDLRNSEHAARAYREAHRAAFAQLVNLPRQGEVSGVLIVTRYVGFDTKSPTVEVKESSPPRAA